LKLQLRIGYLASVNVVGDIVRASRGPSFVAGDSNFLADQLGEGEELLRLDVSTSKAVITRFDRVTQ
jgi:hypothetical protein